MTASFTFTDNIFPAARTSANIRGRDIISHPDFDMIVLAHRSFSVSICDGKGEVLLKKIDGVWHEQIHSCDKVFGFMKSKWNPVKL